MIPPGDGILFGAMRRATPVYVLGDSHVLIYSDRVAERGGELFVFRSLYCPSLRAVDFVAEDGRLDERVRTQMGAARLLVEVNGRDEAFHKTRAREWRAAAVAADKVRETPALVIACGALDVLFRIADLHADDLVLPADLGRRFDVPGICRHARPGALSPARSGALFEQYLRPLRSGIRVLKELGFERLAMLSIPPPTVRSEQFHAIMATVGIRCSAARLHAGFRYKLMLLANDALHALCGEENVTFVNRWNDQTVRGLARSGLLHDAIHIGSEPCAETIGELLKAV
jgi:hypothetical protein